MGGLEREDSGTIFIKILFLSRVVNPYSWEVLTRGGCFIIESREENRFRNKILGKIFGKQHVVVGSQRRVVKLKVSGWTYAAKGVPMLVREIARSFLPSTMELEVSRMVKWIARTIFSLNQA